MPKFKLPEKKEESTEVKETPVFEKKVDLDPVQALMDQNAMIMKTLDSTTSKLDKLQKEVALGTKRSKIIGFAKGVGASEKEATELADNKDLSYEEILEHCLNFKGEHSANMTKGFKGTNPVGDQGTDDLIKGPNNEFEAIKKVKTEYKLEGPKAVAKAKELYPEAFAARFKQLKRRVQGYDD